MHISLIQPIILIVLSEEYEHVKLIHCVAASNISTLSNVNMENTKRMHQSARDTLRIYGIEERSYDIMANHA